MHTNMISQERGWGAEEGKCLVNQGLLIWYRGPVYISICGYSCIGMQEYPLHSGKSFAESSFSLLLVNFLRSQVNCPPTFRYSFLQMFPLKCFSNTCGFLHGDKGFDPNIAEINGSLSCELLLTSTGFGKDPIGKRMYDDAQFSNLDT